MTIEDFIGNEKTHFPTKEVSIEKFFNEFGEMTAKEVLDFLLDKKNTYILGKFFYRSTGQDKYYAYNGFGYYKGCRSTVGASH